MDSLLNPLHPETAARIKLSSWLRSFSMKSLLEGHLQEEEKGSEDMTLTIGVQYLNRCSAFKIQKLEKNLKHYKYIHAFYKDGKVSLAEL
jgi:hypothetical protein